MKNFLKSPLGLLLLPLFVATITTLVFMISNLTTNNMATKAIQIIYFIALFVTASILKDTPHALRISCSINMLAMAYPWFEHANSWWKGIYLALAFIYGISIIGGTLRLTRKLELDEKTRHAWMVRWYPILFIQIMTTVWVSRQPPQQPEATTLFWLIGLCLPLVGWLFWQFNKVDYGQAPTLNHNS